jgi:hypothetical protein
MVKHDIPNRPFMIVQSIDKLPLPQAIEWLLGVTCIWFSSETSEKQVFHKGHYQKTSQ